MIPLVFYLTSSVDEDSTSYHFIDIEVMNPKTTDGDIWPINLHYRCKSQLVLHRRGNSLWYHDFHLSGVSCKSILQSMFTLELGTICSFPLLASSIYCLPVTSPKHELYVLRVYFSNYINNFFILQNQALMC